MCNPGFEWGEWRADVENNNPNAIIKILPDAQRKMFVAVYNKLPPPSSVIPDMVAFLYGPSTMPKAAFVFVIGGCVRLTAAGNFRIMLGMTQGIHPNLKRNNLYRGGGGHIPGRNT